MNYAPNARRSLALAATLTLSLVSFASSADAATVRASAATLPIFTTRSTSPPSVTVTTVTPAVQQAIAATDRKKIRPAGPALRSIAPPRNFTPAKFAALKARAATARAPLARPVPNDLLTAALTGPPTSNTPLSGIFDAMADSGAICQPGGCQPPDMAVAASPQWVLQGVNSSFSVYSAASGTQALGWPLTTNAFLGNGPARVAACDPYGPFISDPRAFYDANDHRFFATVTQIDGPAIGDNACPNIGVIWIAVSQTADPNGSWFVYSFDSSNGGTDLPDYPRFGYDAKTVEYSVNQFLFATGNYDQVNSFYLDKYLLESGHTSPVAEYSSSFCSNSGCVPADTLQPVQTLAPLGKQPGAIWNLLSHNISDNACSSGCNSIVATAIIDPLSPNWSAAGAIISTPTYSNPPNADIEYNPQAVETIDTRITATPVYTTINGGGRISWALETAVNNGTQIVPGILWGQLQTGPTVSDPVTLRQANYIAGSGDTAYSFGATMNTNTGNLYIVADTMSATIYPGTVTYVQRPTDPLGSLRGPFVLKAGVGQDFYDSRWGDYEATAFDGVNVWVASQYMGGGGDWATVLGRLR